MAKILLVDDDHQSLESTHRILTFDDHEVVTASNGQEALQKIREIEDFDLILSDIRMPKMTGLEFFRALSLCGKYYPVIFMTAYGQLDEAVWAMKQGAVDFLQKPFRRQSLREAIDTSLKRAKYQKKSTQLDANQMVGESAEIKNLKNIIKSVAATHATVLIFGESGTGKELVAKSLHQQSARARSSFVALNCSAIPENLIEAELFGFEKGAFSGAISAKQGLFEAAHKGTLFLDEIGDMPLSAQSKLLRVLQDQVVRRVGSTQSIPVNVRVIAATHRDLKQKVKEGTFREDLFFRLSVIEMNVPKLTQRKDDILLLAKHFIALSSVRHSKNPLPLSNEAEKLLLEYPWPGNVRELSNVIERALIFSQSKQIEVSDLPLHLQSLEVKESTQNESLSIPLGVPLKDVEDLLIQKTLEATQGDKQMAAKLLGVNSRTIYRKLEKKPE